MAIGLKQLSKKYGYSEGHFRVLLCRPEFNPFRADSYFVMDDSNVFHDKLKNILKIKKNKYSYWRLKPILMLILILLFNTQIAFCQHYEPVIIYSPSGEPQIMLKGHIKYDNYGVPKSHIQTKRSLRSVR